MNTFEVLPGINCAHGKDAISVGKYTKEQAEKYLDSTLDLTVDSYVYDGSELFALREKNNTNFVESTQHTTYKRPISYSDFLHLKHHIFEETESPDKFTNFTISMGIHIFFSWFLLKNLREYGLMDKYDRFIITRSDFVYQLPHPTLDLLNPENIWIPDGEHHSGLCDRHAVLSRNHLEPYLNIMEQFFTRSNDYYREIQNSNKWNMERILKMNLEKNGVADKVAKFPYIMYLIRTTTELSRWTDGIYIEEFGYYIKYPDEYMLSSYYKSAYENSGLNITDFYHVYGWL
jgi:hypothetical protein